MPRCASASGPLRLDDGYAVRSANSVTEYVPLANFNAMREAAFKYGRYPLEA